MNTPISIAIYSYRTRATGLFYTQNRLNWQNLDARWFQILFLASFLALGALARDFALTPVQVLLTFCSALLTQAAWQWGLDLPGKRKWGGYLSAIISSFDICILVRAANAWVHPLLTCVAMSSKYLIRTGPAACKSHLQNPANLAAFAAFAWAPGAWLSPGQWGSGSLAVLWFVALGGLVAQRISRWDVSLSFLASWAALLAFGWLRLLFKPHGLIVMLFLASWTVPLRNSVWPQRRFQWV